MAEQLLKKYIDMQNLNQSSMSRSIGHTRQTVWNWINDDATVELTDIGIRIRLKSGRIVFESQVAR